MKHEMNEQLKYELIDGIMTGSIIELTYDEFVNKYDRLVVNNAYANMLNSIMETKSGEYNLLDKDNAENGKILGAIVIASWLYNIEAVNDGITSMGMSIDKINTYLMLIISEQSKFKMIGTGSASIITHKYAQLISDTNPHLCSYFIKNNIL